MRYDDSPSRSFPCLPLTLAATALALFGALGQPAFAADPPETRSGRTPAAGAIAPEGRTPLAQPECTLCIVGSPSVQWNGASGSFHVDRVENRRISGVSGPLALQVYLQSTYPEPWDVGVGEYELSDRVPLNPLPAGGSYSNIDSGAIGFHGSNVPAGQYWMLMLLLENSRGIWFFYDYVVMSDKVSCDGSTCAVTGPWSTLLPIVVDVPSSSAHYTTEMALTNNTSSPLTVSLLYTASLGSKQGSGPVTESLAPGEQKKIADVLSYLRDKGLAIPPSAEQPSQGGTLLVTFQGNDAINPRLVSVTARTVALTSAPQPVGRAGLAYSGLLDTESSTSSLTLFGLRSNSTDRTNVAVFNTSSEPVTLKVTVYSGSGDGRSVVFKEAETLPPYGWLQYGSAQILDGTGISKGWVTVERTSATGSFSAYAVINDSMTNDGSFVRPVSGAVSGSTLTVPVLAETPAFRSELILANKGASNATLTLDYVESQSPSSGSGGTVTVTLAPMEEQIIPEAIDYLRAHGANIGAKDAAPYVGALRVTVSGAAAENVFAGARTASQSPAGGQFGLFTPGVYSGQEAEFEANLYGLRADSENRSNVAVVNTGSAGAIRLRLQAYDGDAGGAPKGMSISVVLSHGEWVQFGNFLRNSGIANGWVKVTRLAGTAPWVAYAVVNDGGNPGERTGDGAYVPMTK